MSASAHFADAPSISRSRTARLGRSDRSLEKSNSEPPQSTEETARDRLRAAALRTRGSERESVPDAADQAQGDPEHRPARRDAGAGTTPFKNDRHSQRGGSVRASHETPAEGPATKLARRRKSLRREPQHVASTHPQNAPLEEPPAVIQKREARDPGRQHVGRQDDHVAHTQKNGASQKRIYCGNNALAHELTSGHARVGKRSECFRKGVGGGLHAKIPPAGLEDFITKWTAPYRKLVEQPLHYGDGPTPAGKFPATLSQCLARGFAVGSIQKAKKKMHEAKQLPDADGT